MTTPRIEERPDDNSNYSVRYKPVEYPNIGICSLRTQVMHLSQARHLAKPTPQEHKYMHVA